VVRLAEADQTPGVHIRRLSLVMVDLEGPGCEARLALPG
jgi:hypothetical protein